MWTNSRGQCVTYANDRISQNSQHFKMHFISILHENIHEMNLFLSWRAFFIFNFLTIDCMDFLVSRRKNNFLKKNSDSSNAVRCECKMNDSATEAERSEERKQQ